MDTLPAAKPLRALLSPTADQRLASSREGSRQATAPLVCSRRLLFGLVAGIAVAPRTIFLPPRGGWPVGLLTLPLPRELITGTALLNKYLRAINMVVPMPRELAVPPADWLAMRDALANRAWAREDLEVRHFLLAGIPVVHDDSLRSGEWIVRGRMDRQEFEVRNA